MAEEFQHGVDVESQALASHTFKRWDLHVCSLIWAVDVDGLHEIMFVVLLSVVNCAIDVLVSPSLGVLDHEDLWLLVASQVGQPVVF